MLLNTKRIFSFQNSDVEAMLLESRRLLKESKSHDMSIANPPAGVSRKVKEIFRNLTEAVNNYHDRVEYNVMKYRLANQALHTGLWDMEVIAGDPVNPDNTFVWSDDFRSMLGFTDENDFPNKLNSWSDRLHPDDKERTLNAFAAHMLDYSGETPYDVKYYLKLKNGEYGYFRATGDTVRDHTGMPLRVAGLLLDLAEERRIEDLDKKLMEKVKQDSEIINNINSLVKDFDKSIDAQAKAVDESSHKTENIVNSLKRVSEISQQEQITIKGLLEYTATAQEAMHRTRLSVQSISQLVEGIGSAIEIISSIAEDTNLLAMNAAIEAAHAGEAGKGFSVVASEIRRLSENTRVNSIDISQTLKSIIEGITITSKQSDETDKSITEISKEINTFAQIITDIISTFSKLSDESFEIAKVFTDLKEQTAVFKAGYSQMVTINEKLFSTMNATMNDIAARRSDNI